MDLTNGAGLYHTPLTQALQLTNGDIRKALVSWFLNCMPNRDSEMTSEEIRSACDKYTVDIKIHMLMPRQWPCIPNWHCDFVPRDKDLNKLPELIDPDQKMWLWLSGPPLTQFRNEAGVVSEVTPRTWFEFDQTMEHRGTMSTEHTIRAFIRIVPRALCKPAPPEQWLRRHTQVYCDVNEFEW